MSTGEGSVVPADRSAELNADRPAALSPGGTSTVTVSMGLVTAGVGGITPSGASSRGEVGDGTKVGTGMSTGEGSPRQICVRTAVAVRVATVAAAVTVGLVTSCVGGNTLGTCISSNSSGAIVGEGTKVGTGISEGDTRLGAELNAAERAGTRTSCRRTLPTGLGEGRCVGTGKSPGEVGGRLEAMGTDSTDTVSVSRVAVFGVRECTGKGKGSSSMSYPVGDGT
mmetsp:Transcript_89256/g.213165  ORF Transcript_89256/g.213165 Transcript_89256/m.213165 type:complete len:225 (+) Transcript_89256:351-1025(+)